MTVPNQSTLNLQPWQSTGQLNAQSFNWGHPTPAEFDLVNNRYLTPLQRQAQYQQQPTFNDNGFNENALQQSSGVNGSTGESPSFSLGDINWAQYANAGANLVGAWNGIQQVGIARDSLAEQKRQFNMNWEAQANLTNQQLEARRNRQIAAQGANSGNGLTTAEYVQKYGVKV